MPALTFDIQRPFEVVSESQEALGSLFHVHDFTAFVVTALGAHTMLHARLLTVRANDGLRRAHRIVRPALAAARF